MEPRLKKGESVDDLIIGGLKIIQPLRGYRFSLDAVLLSHFCLLDRVKTVIDLGTGSGVIPLLLTARSDHIKTIGVDIQEEMVERAVRSVCLNHLEKWIKIFKADIKKIDQYLPGGCADLVVSNPPFWRKGEGKLSHNREEVIARHEIDVQLKDIIAAAAYLLQPNGSLAIIQRADRLGEIISLFYDYQLSFSRLRTVHSRWGDEAKLVLAEGKKGTYRAGVKIHSPLVIYNENNEYCLELKKIYQAEK